MPCQSFEQHSIPSSHHHAAYFIPLIPLSLRDATIASVKCHPAKFGFPVSQKKRLCLMKSGGSCMPRTAKVPDRKKPEVQLSCRIKFLSNGISLLTTARRPESTEESTSFIWSITVKLSNRSLSSLKVRFFQIEARRYVLNPGLWLQFINAPTDVRNNPHRTADPSTLFVIRAWDLG